MYVRPARDHLLTSENPFMGCVEVPSQSVAWLWLEVRFESAVARLSGDGEMLVETTGHGLAED
jgi:hypothetical protein